MKKIHPFFWALALGVLAECFFWGCWHFGFMEGFFHFVRMSALDIYWFLRPDVKDLGWLDLFLIFTVNIVLLSLFAFILTMLFRIYLARKNNRP